MSGLTQLGYGILSCNWPSTQTCPTSHHWKELLPEQEPGRQGQSKEAWFVIVVREVISHVIPYN